MYPVHLRLPEENFTVGLAEIREWLDRHRITPGTVRYGMDAEYVRLVIEFTKPQDSDLFRLAFTAELEASLADSAPP
jgi:hypothetical protein